MASDDDLPPPKLIQGASVQRSQPPCCLNLPNPPSGPDHNMNLDCRKELVVRDIDKLVHRLDRKPILQDSPRQERESIRDDERNRIQCRGQEAHHVRTPVQWPSESSPTLCNHPQPLSESKRPRRSTDTRLRSTPNARMLDLVTGMVDNGVCCNIQNSTPSPTRARSNSSTCPSTEHDINTQYPISPPIPTGLKADMDLDEETTSSDNQVLSLSSLACLRKLGFLRYRSSTEAAISCKNIRKSAPRVRRRRGAISKALPVEPRSTIG
ncbi:hypothetical protein GGS21DRAFT_331011 [Xylaria nigripes]|nr:hypothetical protein GGS21DRAFT_331011 [Xylaria nigripes]